jgi:hypothetical protein
MDGGGGERNRCLLYAGGGECKYVKLLFLYDDLFCDFVAGKSITRAIGRGGWPCDGCC